MNSYQRLLFVLPLFAAPAGCCLETLDGAMPGSGGITGGSASGSGTGGAGASSSSSGGVAPLNLCAGVYCAANYACDSADGICKCGGQICDTGNCDPGTGACLEGCTSDGGALAIQYAGATASNAVQLPSAVVGGTYIANFNVVCATEPYQMQMAGPAAEWQGLGLAFYPAAGEISGVPREASDGGPFVLQIEVQDSAGHTAFGNFLLTVE